MNTDITKITAAEAEVLFQSLGRLKLLAAMPIVNKVTQEETLTADAPLGENLSIIKEFRDKVMVQFTSAKPAEVEVSLDGWSMRDLEDFNTTLLGSNFTGAAELMAKVVTAWPFSGRPVTASNYMKLDLLTFGSIVSAVSNAVMTIFLS